MQEIEWGFSSVAGSRYPPLGTSCTSMSTQRFVSQPSFIVHKYLSHQFFFLVVNATKVPPKTYRHFYAALPAEVSVASQFVSPILPADICRLILWSYSYSVYPTRVPAASRAMSTNDLSVVNTSSAEQNCALVSWSGGKDSCLAFFRAKNEGTSCRTSWWHWVFLATSF